VIQLAKGNRKRVNNPTKLPKKKEVMPLITKDALLKDYPIRTLNNADVNRFKELVTLSNNVAGLLKQCVDTDMSIEKGNDTAKQMMSGKIKGVAMMKVTANLFLPMADMRDVARKIKREVGMLKEANKISRGQLSQRYDEYLDSMRNIRTLIDGLLSHAPDKGLAKIRGDRTAGKNKAQIIEQTIFEKEIDKLTDKDKDYLKSIKTKIDEKAGKKKTSKK